MTRAVYDMRLDQYAISAQLKKRREQPALRLTTSAGSSQTSRILTDQSNSDQQKANCWRPPRNLASHRLGISLFQEIAKGNFYAVTGMNFSLFLHECPMGQLINLNKSFRFAHELSKLGVSAIPHIYAVNDNQRKKLTEHIRSNPSINAVIINTQLQKDPYSIAEAVKTVDVVMENTHCKVILNGRKLKIPTNHPGRIIKVNQDGLKQQAIIEKARERLLAR